MGGMFGGGLLGFSALYFEVTLCPPIPVNAQRFYDIINEDREHKTGRVIAWSKIVEE